MVETKTRGQPTTANKIGLRKLSWKCLLFFCIKTMPLWKIHWFFNCFTWQTKMRNGPFFDRHLCVSVVIFHVNIYAFEYLFGSTMLGHRSMYTVQCTSTYNHSLSLSHSHSFVHLDKNHSINRNRKSNCKSFRFRFTSITERFGGWWQVFKVSDESKAFSIILCEIDNLHSKICIINIFIMMSSDDQHPFNRRTREEANRTKKACVHEKRLFYSCWCWYIFIWWAKFTVLFTYKTFGFFLKQILFSFGTKKKNHTHTHKMRWMTFMRTIQRTM